MPNSRPSSRPKKGMCCGPVSIGQESRIPSAPVLLPPSVQRVAANKLKGATQAHLEGKSETEYTARVKELANKARTTSSNMNARRGTLIMDVGSRLSSTPKGVNKTSLQGTSRLARAKNGGSKKADGMTESSIRTQPRGNKTGSTSRQRLPSGDSLATTQRTSSTLRGQSMQQDDRELIKNCARRAPVLQQQQGAGLGRTRVLASREGHDRKENANSSVKEGRVVAETKQRRPSTSQTRPAAETKPKNSQQKRRLPPALPIRHKNDQKSKEKKISSQATKTTKKRSAKDPDMSAPTQLLTSQKGRESATKIGAKGQDSKAEMSLWKKLKQMSTKTLRSRTRGDDSSESSAKVPAKEKRMIFIGSSISRRKSYPGAVQSAAASQEDPLCESICTGQPLPSKNDPEDVSPVSPRSLTITHGNDCPVSTPTRGVKILQRCTVLTPEPSPETVFPRVYESQRCEIQEEPFITAEADSAEIIDDTDSHSQFVFSPATIQKYRPYEESTFFAGRSADLMQTHSSSTTDLCMGDLRMHNSPRRIFSNPLISVSPELPTSRSFNKVPAAVESHDPCLRIPNMPSEHTSEALLATLGSYTPCRSESSQIGAHCEWIRETLKEESKRLMTMTNMLEALQATPRPSTSARAEGASNQDLNRRYIEKINDLQFENRHLRQLLEFSIGTMRRESWVPTPVPATPCYGPFNNSPIGVIDHSDTESEKKAGPNDKQAKKNWGKAPTADPQYIATLTESLDSKEQHLRFIEESTTQITSLKEWYEKRLNELERDRERLHVERADCINELKRCGVESCVSGYDNQGSLHHQQQHPLRSRSMDRVSMNILPVHAPFKESTC